MHVDFMHVKDVKHFVMRFYRFSFDKTFFFPPLIVRVCFSFHAQFLRSNRGTEIWSTNAKRKILSLSFLRSQKCGLSYGKSAVRFSLLFVHSAMNESDCSKRLYLLYCTRVSQRV